MIGTSLNQYRITASIGVGGMGEVFRARDTRLNRDVAVKVLPKDFAADADRLRRFEQEAKTLAALNHPNVLTIHDAGVHEGAPYLVSELLEGRTLREEMSGGTLPVRKATEYALQIAHGLAAAHGKGVIHRDLKPENIFVTKDGRVKILDFGLAKLRNPSPGLRPPSPLGGERDGVRGDAATIRVDPGALFNTTEPGLVLGTPAYMSPEQVRGEPADHRADIFAFGSVLYEMLSGTRAFRRDTPVESMNAVLSEEPPDLSASNANIPTALERVVRRCLEKSPERRFQSTSDLAFALENLQGTSSSARLQTIGPANRILSSKWMLAGLSAALGAICAALWLWSAFRQSPQQTSRTQHVSIALPAGLTLLPNNRPLIAISPDGSRVVYSARGTNGTLMLWEQRFDQPVVRPLRGTEGADTPFFSPDGKWIGYIVGERQAMMKVSVEGGAPVTIVENTGGNNHGSSWSSDGNIYYSPEWSHGIWKVNAEGNSTPVQILKPDPQKNDRALIWPYAMPDGKTILFTVWTGETFDANKVVAYSVASAQQKEIFRGAQVVRYVSTGHIVFAREGSLYVVPFDARRLERSGPERLLLQGVAMGATEGEAQFSISDQGSLVYLPGGMGVRRMNLVWLDRQGVSRPVPGAHSVVYAPSVSPDGSSLSFDVGIASKVDVYTFDAQRSIANKISTTGDDYYSIWTPDSKKLVFNSGRLGGQTLFWRNADGTGPEEPLTSSEGGKRATSVSPDGKVLAFSWRTTGSYDVWTLPLDGADHRPVGLLTNSWHELDAKFSPKGNWLAYSSEESGRMEIYIQAYPGAGRRTRVSSDGGRIPVWSRDGQELFFVSGRKLMVVESLAKDSFQPGKPKELFEGGFEDSFDIGINGQEFLMLQPDLAAAETHFNWIQNWTALLDNERAGRKP